MLLFARTSTEEACGKGCAAPAQSSAQQPSPPACLHYEMSSSLFKTSPKFPHSPRREQGMLVCAASLCTEAQQKLYVVELGEKSVKARPCYTCFSPWVKDENKACLTDVSHVVQHTTASRSDTTGDECCVSTPQIHQPLCYWPQGNRTIPQATGCSQPSSAWDCRDNACIASV